jgi:hypothetical protein
MLTAFHLILKQKTHTILGVTSTLMDDSAERGVYNFFREASLC